MRYIGKLHDNMNIQAKGHLSVFSGKAYNITTDNQGNILSYDFERNKQVFGSRQQIARVGFFRLLQNGFASSCVIAIGNGDNGTVNGTGGPVNPVNAPNENDIRLNQELRNGRYPALGRANRLNLDTGVATWNALIPFNAYSGLITEWGLFAANNSNSVEINTRGAGFLVARKAEVFQKDPADDLDVIWTIETILNP